VLQDGLAFAQWDSKELVVQMGSARCHKPTRRSGCYLGSVELPEALGYQQRVHHGRDCLDVPAEDEEVAGEEERPAAPVRATIRTGGSGQEDPPNLPLQPSRSERRYTHMICSSSRTICWGVISSIWVLRDRTQPPPRVSRTQLARWRRLAGYRRAHPRQRAGTRLAGSKQGQMRRSLAPRAGSAG
jgi:hypothetical protein